MKAVGLISGGLDSALATKIIGLQGIEVFGISFITPFVYPKVEKLAQNIGIMIKVVDVSKEYLNLIKNPCFGYGKNLNPCIDCHIFMLRRAKEFMFEHKANFVVSGEVLGQRPMSQNKATLGKIEKESGLEGLLLRPLSAKLLPITIPEQNSWVERGKFFDFSGRSRKPQIELARQLALEGFGQPAGGCVLTDPGFSRRLKDLMAYNKEFNLDDIQLLKLGRHFRLSNQAKLVLGRNHQENQSLIGFMRKGSMILKPINIPGPTGLLILQHGLVYHDLLELSAGILVRYCDDKNGKVNISVENCERGSYIINCLAMNSEDLDTLRI